MMPILAGFMEEDMTEYRANGASVAIGRDGGSVICQGVPNGHEVTTEAIVKYVSGEVKVRLDGYALIPVEMYDELATLRAENERLRILVKDSVNLLDFLFEPGSYVPAVRLFCERVKEELK